ncbi:MAG: COX15/CtaA family protein [Ekhidna sp.]|nr:COX15/CtaA family protein [Ekhidna sp.]
MRRFLKTKYFYRINTITIGSVLLLILVGSVVRVSGSGMGCPDWPKCFGQYIPPTSVSELPHDYQDVYRSKRLEKNDRLAAYFLKFGYEDLAVKITSDPAVLVEQEFNVTKTWIEYINRLLGVVIGFLVLSNMVLSFALTGKSVMIPIAGIAVFVLTGFQGWVGSLVVSTNLLHGFITFHMLLAVLIVAILIWMNVSSRGLDRVNDKTLFFVLLFTTILYIPQLIFGTEVRGVVDGLLLSTPGRSDWVNELGSIFYIHRSYSWLILIGCFFIWYRARKVQLSDYRVYSKLLVGMVVLIMLFGVGMARFGFPAWLQPLHLLFAVSIFSILIYLNLRTNLKI